MDRDCEKFEPLLLDELYEELDELTSAAVKRHVSGCARCGSILNGMRSTRRAVTLPLEPIPEGLEDRILAAAKEAQKVVPIKGRFGRVVSVAGNWAMRPQTAMAAVFLLMIGTSALLSIRSKDYRSKDSAVSVTVAGAPAPQAIAATVSPPTVADPRRSLRSLRARPSCARDRARVRRRCRQRLPSPTTAPSIGSRAAWVVVARTRNASASPRWRLER